MKMLAHVRQCITLTGLSQCPTFSGKWRWRLHPHKVCPSKAELERGSNPTGIKVTDEQLATVNMTPDEFHGD
jgi:hypothetical protein